MQKTIEQRTFKVIGLYAVIILALVRFMVYPLNEAGAKKQAIYNDLYETYLLKAQHSARQDPDRGKSVDIRTDKEAIGRSLYEKVKPFSAIQVELLESIIKIAQKNGLTVQNFEMQEPTTGKIISDVPVRIVLTGKPKDQINLLKALLTDERIMVMQSLEMSNSGKDILLAMTIVAFRMEK